MTSVEKLLKIEFKEHNILTIKTLLVIKSIHGRKQHKEPEEEAEAAACVWSAYA